MAIHFARHLVASSAPGQDICRGPLLLQRVSGVGVGQMQNARTSNCVATVERCEPIAGGPVLVLSCRVARALTGGFLQRTALSSQRQGPCILSFFSSRCSARETVSALTVF